MQHVLSGSLLLNPLDIPGVDELARLSNVTLGRTLSTPAIRRLNEVWGDAAKIRGLDITYGLPSRAVLKLLADTGVLRRQPMRTIYGPVLSRKPVVGLLLGASVPQMTRRILEYDRYFVKSKRSFKTHVVLCSSVRTHNLGEVGPLSVRLNKVPAAESEVMELLLADMFPIGAYIKAESLEEQVSTFAVSTYPCSVYVAGVANRLHEVLLLRRVLRRVWGDTFDAPEAEHSLYFSQDAIHLATTHAELSVKGYQAPLDVFPNLALLLHELFLLQETSN